MVWNSSTTSVTGLRAAGGSSWPAPTIARAARFSSVPPTSAAMSSPTSNAFRLTITSLPVATSSRKSIVERGWPTIWRATRLPRYLWTLVWTGLMISS